MPRRQPDWQRELDLVQGTEGGREVWAVPHLCLLAEKVRRSQ